MESSNKPKSHLTVKRLSVSNKAIRILWNAVWLLLYRFSPTPFFAWRRFLLRSFGASIHPTAHPYPSSRVWAPWNLVMGAGTCLSHHVNCYSVDRVELADGATISQNSHLCTATHDYTKRSMPLMTAPIIIKRDAWVTADVFIGPGVTIGEQALVAARACVVKDVNDHQMVGGNPAKVIGTRTLTDG